MKQSLKVRIAKEIIIFFSSIAFIVLIWSIFWLKNNYSLNHLKDLKGHLNMITNKMDSIQATYPEKKPFEKMFILKNFSIPISNALTKNEEEHKRLKEILGKPENESNENILKLYIILENSNYPFNVSPFNKFDLPMFDDFYKYISAEFEKDFPEKKELKSIYDFLVAKQYIVVEFDEFVLNLEGFPLPPTHDTWTLFEKYKNQKIEIENQIKNADARIYSNDDLAEIALWIGIFTLVAIYPFRLIILLLIWAFKTLKQK